MFLHVILVEYKVVMIRINIAIKIQSLLHLCGPFLIGHIRDPNNQLHMVKNLRICVNNVTTSSSTPLATLSPAQGRVLSDVVSSCQPHEGAVTSAITAGDYDLSVTGKKPPTDGSSPRAGSLESSRPSRRFQDSGCCRENST